MRHTVYKLTASCSYRCRQIVKFPFQIGFPEIPFIPVKNSIFTGLPSKSARNTGIFENCPEYRYTYSVFNGINGIAISKYFLPLVTLLPEVGGELHAREKRAPPPENHKIIPRPRPPSWKTKKIRYRFNLSLTGKASEMYGKKLK